MGNVRTHQPRKAPRQARSKQTVDAILKAATAILIRDGYEGLNTNRVAERAGVGVGSLYQYFPNKEALVLTLLDAHVNEHVVLLSNMAQAMVEAPVDLAVRQYVRTMLEAHADHPRLHLTLMTELPRICGFGKVMEFNRRAQTVVMAYLEAHAERIRPRNLPLAAMMLVSAVDACMHACLLTDPALLKSDEVVEEISQLVLGYLRPAMVQ